MSLSKITLKTGAKKHRTMMSPIGIRGMAAIQLNVPEE